MIKEQISEDEIIFIKKVFNRELFKSLFIVPFFLFLLPIYLLIFVLILGFFDVHIDFFYEYLFFILLITLLNFLYGKIIINKKNESRVVYKVQDDFIIINKEEGRNPSSDITNDYGTNYYKVFLKNDNEQRKIEVNEEYHKIIKEGEIITIIYYNIVDIPIKGIYQGHEIKINAFSIIKKYRILNFIR